IRSLRKYINSDSVRKEKSENARTLGEVLKQHRVSSKMTQEFVAETIGVSRQAVSKWESGASDPSTTNLMALAKLFNVSAEDLLKEAK
ncbi:MAG: helix-turn-helix domain-containing protein, partial [Acetatifactor sp.]|nr:helix-turn-helix domain-containing protein [Acetatifactor sp.]